MAVLDELLLSAAEDGGCFHAGTVTHSPRSVNVAELSAVFALDGAVVKLGPMQGNLLVLFEAEVLQQCRVIIRAGRELATARADDDVWYALQAMLTAATIAQRLLWGGKVNSDVAVERGPLRERLCTGDDSPLALATVRDAFEHIDQRMGGWVEAHQGITVARYVGARDSLETSARRRVFKHFDPATGMVGFGKDEVSTRALVAEAERIVDRWREIEPFWAAVHAGRGEEYLAQQRSARADGADGSLPSPCPD
jgi:hypothetical protein